MASNRSICKSRLYSILISAVVFFLLVGCGAPASIPPSPSSTVGPHSATFALPSPTPQVPLDTPTSIPPSPTPQPQAPTDTVTPVLASDPTATVTTQPTVTAKPITPTTGSIVLAAGTTAGVVQGTLQPGQVVTYSLAANQSQPLTLIMKSANNDVTLGVFDAKGNALLDPASKYTRWQIALPGTEVYTIRVIGGATTEDYALTVKLPQVVQFSAGTTSTQLSGTTKMGYLYSYSLSAGAGQTMTASLNVPSSTAYIDIYGLYTGTLLSDSARANTWTGVLPQTQDYVIEVVPANGQVVDYSLSVSITGAVSTSVLGGNIVFARGTTAAVEQGSISPGQVITYTVQANKVQPMILIAESPKWDLTLGVIDPDGSVLLSPTEKWSHWQWQLPKTGLYTIQVFGGKTTEKFVLTVKIAQVVYFPTGSTSITLNGDTNLGYVVSYAFRCSAGQVMTASLNVPDSSKVYLDIFGVKTGSLLDEFDRATSWTGTLPETQEYVVEVIPRGGYLTSYSLTVSIP